MMHLSFKTLILLFAVSFLLPACNKERGQKKEDQERIEEYAENKGWNTTKTESGLHYVLFEEGEGEHPTISNEVTVNYVGRLRTDQVFDENENISFPLANVIEGWQEGIPKFKAGGSGALLIPSHLGYGENGSGNVPPNEIMVFEIDLLSFE